MYSSDMYMASDIADATMSSAPMLGLFLGIIIFSLVLGLIFIISYWKIFNKAGKPGIASIIPIYNYIVMIKIAKLSLVYIVLLLIPVINIYAVFKINIEIVKKFGKTSGFGIGLTLLPIIFAPLLAFSDNVYESNIKEVETPTNTDNNINSINETSEANNNIEKESMMQAPINNVELNNQPESVEQINNSENLVEKTVVENDSSLEEQSIVKSVVNAPVVDEAVVDMVPPVIENTILPSNDVPVITEEKVEPVQTLNAFNSKPIEPQTTNEETPSIEMKINNEVSLEQNLETVKPQPITEIPVINETFTETKKVCKNCGEVLPNIVSICPKCGTDNE